MTKTLTHPAEVELVLIGCFWCVCAKYIGLFAQTPAYENALQKRAPLFTNCRRAVLSIAQHSRETQMALTLGDSLVNWGISGVSLCFITSVAICEFVCTIGCPMRHSFLQVGWQQSMYNGGASFAPAGWQWQHRRLSVSLMTHLHFNASWVKIKCA